MYLIIQPINQPTLYRPTIPDCCSIVPSYEIFIVLSEPSNKSFPIITDNSILFVPTTQLPILKVTQLIFLI